MHAHIHTHVGLWLPSTNDCLYSLEWASGDTVTHAYIHTHRSMTPVNTQHTVLQKVTVAK